VGAGDADGPHFRRADEWAVEQAFASDEFEVRGRQSEAASGFHFGDQRTSAVAFHRNAWFGADGGEDAVEDVVILGVVFAAETTVRFSNSRTSSRKSFPSAVSVTPRGLRRSRSTPISSSRSCTCRLNAGCATRSCAAALVKFNASPTARKYRRCRSSIAEFHYAEKAWLRKERGIRRIENGKVNHLQMNSREEIRQAFEDYQLGRMGGLTL
jgi:hypothetical protein